MALAVMATMRTGAGQVARLAASSARISRVASKPFNPGIWQSMRMTG